MEVAMSELRAELRRYVQLVREGEDVVVTDRGIPVARLTAVDAAPLLERLERAGAISPARGPRIHAHEADMVRATGPVAELLDDLRR